MLLFAPLRRLSPLLRAGVAFCLTFTASGLAAGGAWALDDGRDVPRVVSFGGFCVKCDLSSRKLAGARFVGGDFQRAAFIGADLRGAVIVGSNFSGADFSRADLRGSAMTGATFQNADFTRANLVGLEALGATFLEATLQGARLDSGTLLNADLRRVKARGASFAHANLTGANLEAGDFEGASFEDADLLGATLGSGQFAKANFKGARLRGAQLQGTDLTQAINLTKDQVAGACGDRATRLPGGLIARPCVGRLLIVRRVRRPEHERLPLAPAPSGLRREEHDPSVHPHVADGPGVEGDPG